MKKSKLKEYNKKRDFGKTNEPEGSARKSKKGTNSFVIQKHDASTLHYDLRIEVDGVLKSWVLPKGPSTDPSEKRLAIPTEDHPMDYLNFEGEIPEDEYGGGKVIVWDGGSYRNLRGEDDDARSMSDSIKEGKVEIWLEGKKLKGGYALIKGGKNMDDKWLFVKVKDEEADARRNPVSTQPGSIISGKKIS